MITVQLEVPIFFSGSEIRHIKEGVVSVLAASLEPSGLSPWHWSVFKPVDQEPAGVFVTVHGYPRGISDHLRKVAVELAQEIRLLHQELAVSVTVRLTDSENQGMVFLEKDKTPDQRELFS